MYYGVSWVQAIVPSGAWCAYEEFRRAKISELAENRSETGWTVPSALRNTMVFMICTMGMWALNNG